MGDLRKLAGNLSEAAAQENSDSYQHYLMQEASVELRKVVNLIEKLEKDLANAKTLQSHSNHIVKLKKEVDSLKSKAGGYDSIMEWFEKNPLFKEVKQECFKDQVFGGSTIVITAFEKAYEAYEER